MKTYDIECQGEIHRIGVKESGHYILVDHDFNAEALAEHLGADTLPCCQALFLINTNKGDAIWWASKRNYIGVVNLLLDDPFFVKLKGDDAWRALLIASHKGHCDIIALLLERDPPNEYWMRKALVGAAKNNQLNAVKLLVEVGGASLDELGAAGGPLYWAQVNGHLYVVEYLERRRKSQQQ